MNERLSKIGSKIGVICAILLIFVLIVYMFEIKTDFNLGIRIEVVNNETSELTTRNNQTLMKPENTTKTVKTYNYNATFSF